MRKRFKFIFLSLVLFSSGPLFAQNEIYKLEQKTRIQETADEFSRQQSKRYEQSLALAKQQGIKITDQIGERTISLQQINELGEALYLGVESNQRSAKITRTDQLYSNGGLGLSLNGNLAAMEGKLAIWDGGSVLATHQEFGGRVINQEANASTDLHATHVAGTMVAGGQIASARGMAFGASLKSWDYNNDNAEISSASPNLLISNHSYGYQAGWVYDSTKNKWQWWGNDAISNVEDYKFGFYDSNTQTLDRIAFNAPYYLITKSAGNSRSENGPDFTKGEYYLLKNTRDSSNIVRAKNNAYDIISTTGNAKNILTVGAVESINQAPNLASEIRVSSFSSWGPTDDGRIKPDIMGVGTDILSTTNTSNASYSSLNGTSMSAPQVGGSLFLLQQLYHQLNAGKFMRAATLKGLVIHTAMDFGPLGPDYQSGWGLLHTENAAKVLQNTTKSHVIRELTLTSGSTYTEKLIASGSGNITATISWTDPEGNVLPLNSSALNNRSPRLINDLDIKIQDSKGTYLPFTLNPEDPSALAKTGVNNLDNVEKILIPNTIPGENYTLTVGHKGSLKNGQQDFSLLISGIGGTSYCAINASSPKTILSKFTSDLKPITNTLDSTGVGMPIEIGETKTANLQFTNTNTKNVRALVDWNQDGDFDDPDELIITANNVQSSSLNIVIKASQNSEIGQRYKLRIIASFDGIAGNCSNLTNGQLLETTLQITQASNDLAVTSLVSSSGSFCESNGKIAVVAKLKNTGSKAQSNIPVEVTISTGGQLLSTLKGTLTQINAGQEKELGLQGDGILEAGKRYTFELKSLLANDQYLPNNALQLQQTIEKPQAPVAQGTQCTPGTLVNLSASSEGALWYSNNTLVGAGAKVSLPASATYTVGQADFVGNLQPTTKAAYGSGSYFNNFGPEPIIEVKSPIVLESARIYVGTSGTITFSIYNNSTGELIASVSKEVEATRTQSNSTRVAGQLIDDKNDPGQVVFLNLPFPKAGTYLISQACSNGASIFRSNRSLADTLNAPVNIGYPYTIPNILSITGAKFNGAPITSAYYYFYDMKFKSIGCPSPRSAITINSTPSPTVSISPTGNLTLCSNEAKPIVATISPNASVQWLLNGSAINGATQASFTANKAGLYQAQVSNGNCTNISGGLTLKYNNPSLPLISYLNGILTSSPGQNLQWFLNGNPIPGANSINFAPIESGIYTIKLTDTNGCPATSDNYRISILANEEKNPYLQITAFPNPTQKEVILGLPDEFLKTPLKVQVWNIQGQLMREGIYSTKDKRINIDVAEFPNGNYLIQFPEIPEAKGVKFIKF